MWIFILLGLLNCLNATSNYDQLADSMANSAKQQEQLNMDKALQFLKKSKVASKKIAMPESAKNFTDEEPVVHKKKELRKSTGFVNTSGFKAKRFNKSCKGKCKVQPINLPNPALNVSDNKFYVFVSFSMPKESLSRYSRELAKIGGIMVIRGLIDNDMLKTVAKIKKYNIDVAIDPNLFEEFAVINAPTFVYTNIRDGENKQFDKITGHITIRQALELFIEQGKTIGCKKLLTKLGGKL